MSSRQVRRYLKRWKIKPLGKVFLKPQVYPNDSGSRLLLRLGLNAANQPTVKMVAQPGNGRDRAPSLKQLRTVRTQARRAR